MMPVETYRYCVFYKKTEDGKILQGTVEITWIPGNNFDTLVAKAAREEYGNDIIIICSTTAEIEAAEQ